MKKINAAVLVVISIWSISCNNARTGNDENEKKGYQNSDKGNKAPSGNFTGTVWLYPFATDTLAYWSTAKVTFERAARSNWHFHPGKQVLVIAEGAGYLKEKGKPVQKLRKGDVVTIQPGVEHWHGATTDSSFVQIVVNPNIEKGVVNWLGKVTDEEYSSGN